MSGEYFTHGLTLTLAWFVAANAAGSALAVLACALSARSDSTRSARFWMLLRLAPAAAGTMFAIGLFAPSYWKYEPREGVEGFDVSITLIAAIGVILLIGAGIRVAGAWFSARRRVRNWMARARPMTIAATTLPVYAVDADRPMIALVGVLRPSLLITSGLLDVLTPAELEAAVAHEIGHKRGLDNLKRLAMCGAPDFLTFFQPARAIERRWAAAAEHVADCISGPNPAAARCALASALVKVARLTPATVGHAEPISTLISGGDIAARVQRLLSDDEHNPAANRSATAALALACIVASIAAYGPLLRSLHEVTEVLVHTLP